MRMPPPTSKILGTRSLSEEEKFLWAKVKKTVVPLDAANATDRVATRQGKPDPAKTKASGKNLDDPKPAVRLKKQPKPAGLDRRTRTRLSRGRSPVEGSIDLHGMRQDEAYRALRGFLSRSQQRGDRFVIVVTGKGSGSYERDTSAYGGPGVLRSVVPKWFATDSFRDLVAGYSEASRSHGGSGALYVQVRQ